MSALFAASPCLVGCSQLDQWLTDHAAHRTFRVRADWVVQGTQFVNMGFRKINRFTPIFYTHPEKGDLIIQANAIDGVAAYEKSSGREIWRKSIVNGVESSAKLVGDRLFVGANDGYFYCLSAKDGEVIWSFASHIENLAEPLIVEGLVIFLSGANTVYALDEGTGKQVWLYARQDAQSLSVRGGSRPAYHDGSIFLGFSDGALVALVAKTGTVKWEKQLNRNKRFRDLDSNPLIDGEFLYVAGFDDRLYALRTLTGDLVWKSERGGYGSPMIAKDRIFYATTSETFDCLDRTNGQLIWSFPIKEGIATSSQIYKGLIVFGESQGQLQFLDLETGKKVASFDPGRGLLSPPAVDEKSGHVFFISGEANVYSVSAVWDHFTLIPYLH
ncbi:MAG: hypothetical protein C5B49_10235 [Bdellovibrio sp.]|nr:MAG: hypothetical protein C5B49_10235 [Bdellovibrio sp.]